MDKQAEANCQSLHCTEALMSCEKRGKQSRAEGREAGRWTCETLLGRKVDIVTEAALPSGMRESVWASAIEL